MSLTIWNPNPLIGTFRLTLCWPNGVSLISGLVEGRGRVCPLLNRFCLNHIVSHRTGEPLFDYPHHSRSGQTNKPLHYCDTRGPCSQCGCLFPGPAVRWGLRDVSRRLCVISTPLVLAQPVTGNQLAIVYWHKKKRHSSARNCLWMWNMNCYWWLTWQQLLYISRLQCQMISK